MPDDLRRESFEAWLGEKRPRERVGFKRASSDCPLVRFLHDTGLPKVFVLLETYWPYGFFSDDRPLPDWALRFRRAVDAAPVQGIMACRALKILQEIPR